MFFCLLCWADSCIPGFVKYLPPLILAAGEEQGFHVGAGEGGGIDILFEEELYQLLFIFEWMTSLFEMMTLTNVVNTLCTTGRNAVPRLTWRAVPIEPNVNTSCMVSNILLRCIVEDLTSRSSIATRIFAQRWETFQLGESRLDNLHLWWKTAWIDGCHRFRSSSPHGKAETSVRIASVALCFCALMLSSRTSTHWVMSSVE